jgi:hypothetical protein
MSVRSALGAIVNVVFAVSAAGVNVMRRLPSESAIDPATSLRCRSPGRRPRLNHIERFAELHLNRTLTGTLTAPSGGLVATMLGPSVSAAKPVLNENENGLSRLPPVSLMFCDGDMLNERPTLHVAAGTNDANSPLDSTCTRPATCWPVVLSKTGRFAGVSVDGRSAC